MKFFSTDIMQLYIVPTELVYLPFVTPAFWSKYSCLSSFFCKVVKKPVLAHHIRARASI